APRATNLMHDATPAMQDRRGWYDRRAVLRAAGADCLVEVEAPVWRRGCFRVLILLLLWPAAAPRPALAQGTPPDPGAIADVMAALEAALIPYRVEYRVVDRREGGTLWSNAYHGSFFEGRNAFIRRLVRYTSKRPSADAFRREDFVRTEFIHASASQLLMLWRRLEPAPGAWNARILTRGNPRDDGVLIPAHFGLELVSRSVSGFLRRPSARVVGREDIGSFRCWKVLVDLVDEQRCEIRVPVALWLSEEHGFHPVKIAVYWRAESKAAQKYVDDHDMVLDGTTFRAWSVRFVDELMPVGDAWFPVRCRQLVLFEMSRGVITLEVDRETARFGEQVTSEDASLPGAVLSDGSKCGPKREVSAAELAAWMGGEGGELAAPRRGPGAIPVLVFLAGLGLAALLFGRLRFGRRAGSRSGR
ncbi:MAG: hypothetical protein ACE5JG_13235, partial [Planctomycetota bacterium]